MRPKTERPIPAVQALVAFRVSVGCVRVKPETAATASGSFSLPARKDSTMLATDAIYLDSGIIQVYFAFVVAMLVTGPTAVLAGLVYAWVEQRAARK